MNTEGVHPVLGWETFVRCLPGTTEKRFGSSCTPAVGHKMAYEYPERWLSE